MRPAALLALIVVAVGFGCRGEQDRPAGSARPVENIDGQLSIEEAKGTPDLPPVVPEFRLRLDPVAHAVETTIELDVPQAVSLHLLFRTEWEGYPGLEDRIKQVEVFGPNGTLEVANAPDALGPGHLAIEVQQPGRIIVTYISVLAPLGGSLFYHRVSQLAEDGGHLIGNDFLPRVWLGVPRAGPQPAKLWFTGMPPDWRIATVESRSGTGFDIDEILKAVFVVGPLRTHRLNIGPRSLSSAIHGSWPVRDDRVVDAVNEIAGSLHRIAGEGWAAGEYLLGAGRVPASVPGSSTGGQVIGRSSIVYVGGSGPADLEFKHWMHTTSHELMHWYIPTAFAFDSESPPAWFSEGFTDYMALKILLVGDLIEPAEFLAAIGQRLARYRENPLYGSTSILEAQDDFWTEEAYRFIYDGGAAAAFLLDLGFQDRGGSLERALRGLQKQNPVTVGKVTTALAGVRENRWINDWLKAGANPDWEARFSQYGLAIKDGRLISLNDWTTDALSSIRP